MQRRSFALLLAAHLISQQAPAGPLVTSSNAAAGEALTLSAALNRTRAHHPALAASRHQRDAAEGASRQARRWTNPELEISAEDIPAGSGGLSSAQNMIGISQTIPFPGKKRLDAGIAQQAVLVAEAALQSQERSLLHDVRTAFLETLAAEKRVEATAELLSLTEAMANATRKRVESGAAARQEWVRADIETDRVRATWVAAGRELTKARLSLAARMGEPDRPIGPLDGSLREQAPAYAAPALHQAQTNDPRIRAAAALHDRAGMESDRAQRDAFPDVTVGLAAGRIGATDENVFELRASIPLPLLDRSQGRRREARALAEAAHFDHLAATQEVQREFGQANARLVAAQEQADLYRTRILPKATEALNLVRGGFDAGKFGFLDLVDTQRTAAEARLDYLDKLLELNLAIAELETLAGLDISE